MKFSSKYFTPPLTEDDKGAILEALGLGSYAFTTLQFCGTQLLRTQEICGAFSSVSLKSWEEGASKTQEGPCLSIRYEPSLPLVSPDREQSLWEELFPSSFALLSYLFRNQQGILASGSPGSWVDEIHYLANAINSLGTRMSRCELSCIWFDDSKIPLPLIVHYVRKKRIRIGIARHLIPLAKSRPFFPNNGDISSYFGCIGQVCHWPRGENRSLRQVADRISMLFPSESTFQKELNPPLTL